MSEYFFLEEQFNNSKRLRAERDRARELRKTPWWKEKIRSGTCHYCGAQVGETLLTMDHVVPLARGGKSIKGNLVPSCSACNRNKKLNTPVDSILDQLESSS